VDDALSGFRPWLADRAEIVAESDTAKVDAGSFPDADLAIVLGGDGTMLSMARLLVDKGIALLGVNFGKLGFLAEFSLEDVKQYWDDIANERYRMSERLLINVEVYGVDAPTWGGSREQDYEQGQPNCEPKFRSIAMNDAVITAGEPFRMIELELAIDPTLWQTSATTFAGDGVVVATPSGSTAYNIAAGGPIVSPGINALAITAICPQSLAFRPLVVNAACDIWLRTVRCNPGTTLVIDGQESVRLNMGEQVRVYRHDQALKLVHNPSLNYWKMLAKKMRWAVRPRRG